MSTCGEPLVLVGLLEWPIGDCRKDAGHPPPHRITRRNVAGKEVVIEWEGEDVRQVLDRED